MNNSKAKTKKESKPITSQQYRKLFLFLSFFIPLEMMLMVFARSIVYPFGDQSFLNSDLYHQYYPVFQEFVNKIKAGEGIFYSWNMGMGMNFFVVFANNLTSPLNWLAFLCPQKYLIEFISYLVVFKVGLAGLTSYLFFVNRIKGDSVRVGYFALLFSYCYAMNGYIAAYNVNIMWMDCIVIAPIVFLGLERLVREGKTGIYIASLAFCIYSNFYIAFMTCVFLVMYFAFLFFTESRKKETIWRFIYSSLLAGGMAAIILVPVMAYALNSNIEQASFPSNIETYFSVFKVVARHCMLIKTSGDHGSFPNVFCGTAVFLFVPLYYMNRNISIKKKIGTALLIVVFLLSFMVNVLDYVWHGMNYPSGFPARHSFLYILLLLTMGFDLANQIETIKKKEALISLAAASAFLIMTRLFWQTEDFHRWDWAFTLSFVIAYAICILLYCMKENPKVRERVAITFYLLVLADCTLNMSETSVMTTDRDRLTIYMDDYKALYSRNVNNDLGFQRFESESTMTDDDPALYGYPSASVFSSLLNTSVSDFFAKMGMQHGKVYVDPIGATPFCSALMNDSYLFSWNESKENELIQNVDQENSLFLYQSVYTLPFGYVGPRGFDLGSHGNAIELQNDLVRQLGIKEELFSKVESVDKAGLDYLAQTDGFYYAVVDGNVKRGVSIDRQEKRMNLYDMLRDNYVLDLGYVTKGERLLFSSASLEDDSAGLVIDLYRLDKVVLENAIKKLNRNHMTQVEIKDTYVKGQIEMEESGRVVATIPYDKGWKVSVNGEKITPQWFGDAFLAIDFEPGFYEIEMHYFPLGLKLGIGISLFSLLIFGLLIFCGKRKAIVHFS